MSNASKASVTLSADPGVERLDAPPTFVEIHRAAVGRSKSVSSSRWSANASPSRPRPARVRASSTALSISALRRAALTAQRVGLAVATLLGPRQPQPRRSCSSFVEERAALLHEPRQVVRVLVRGDDDVDVRAGGGDKSSMTCASRAGPSVWRMCTPQSISRYFVRDLPAGSASRKQSPSPCRYIRTISSLRLWHQRVRTSASARLDAVCGLSSPSSASLPLPWSSSPCQ